MEADIFSQTEADKPEYQNHAVFKTIDKGIEFYDHIDYAVMGFATIGTKSIINIDSMLYSSIKGTLESINMVLNKGHIGDAFCLLRKYYDSCILNLYTNVFLGEHKDTANIFVSEVVQWLDGKEKLPHNTFKAMRSYLVKSEISKEIIDLVFSNQNYEETRQRCNDYTHYNYFDNVLANDNKLHFYDRVSSLNKFQNDLENILIFHTSCLFHINGHYMAASDYMDALEMGIQPESNSQYWVAPFIQNFFDVLICTKRPDVAIFIKKHTAMMLE